MLVLTFIHYYSDIAVDICFRMTFSVFKKGPKDTYFVW